MSLDYLKREQHGFGQGVYEQSATQNAPLGARLVLEDGNGGSIRVFRYAKAGGTALVAGKLQASAANGGSTTVQKNMTIPTIASPGGYQVSVTAVTDAITANQFAEGFFTVYDGTAGQGVGQTYQIKTNTLASAGGVFGLELYDPLIVQVHTSAKGSVVKHPYDSVIINPSTASGMPVGVPLIAVTASYYCWLQTWGPVCLLSDGTMAYATGLAASDAVNGAVEPVAGDLPEIGYAMNDAADTKYGCVFLQIAP